MVRSWFPFMCPFSAVPFKVQPKSTFTCSKSTVETLEKAIYLKFTIKTPEQHHWWRQNYFTIFFKVSIVDFEQVNVGWDKLNKYTKKHFCQKFLKKPKPTSSENILKILNWLNKAKYVYDAYQNGWVVSFIPGKAILPLKTHSRASDHIWQLKVL